MALQLLTKNAFGDKFMKLNLKSGWSYCSEQILQFEEDLVEGPLNVLELGAGDSSIKIKNYLKESGREISYLCYETNSSFAPQDGEIEVVMYSRVEETDLREEKYDLVLVDGPTGVTRKFWYEKLKEVVKSGTIVHIDDYDHYTEFEEELKKHLTYEELYRKSRKVKGEKSWLTVKIQ